MALIIFCFFFYDLRKCLKLDATQENWQKNVLAMFSAGQNDQPKKYEKILILKPDLSGSTTKKTIFMSVFPYMVAVNGWTINTQKKLEGAMRYIPYLNMAS